MSPSATILFALTFATASDAQVPQTKAGTAAVIEEAEKALASGQARRHDERRQLTERLQAAYRTLQRQRDVWARLEQDNVDDALTPVSVDEIRRKREALNKVGKTDTTDDGKPSTDALSARLDALKAGVQTTYRSDITLIDRDGRSKQGALLSMGRAAQIALLSHAVGLVDPEDERTLAQVDIPEDARSSVAAFRSGKLVALPFDVDGALSVAGPPLSPEGGLIARGGPLVWVILLVALLGIGLLLERARCLWIRRSPPELIDRVVKTVRLGQPEDASQMVVRGRTDLERILQVGLANLNEPLTLREARLEAAIVAEEPELERSLDLLAAAAGAAPLLGLLGTVSGIISTFASISEGGSGDPKLLSGGISVALINTQLGLLVAIPLLLGHAIFSRSVDRRFSLLERARAEVLTLSGRETAA
jgi:biopolymer transport protein ExbB